jgi:hypothetical protein
MHGSSSIRYLLVELLIQFASIPISLSAIIIVFSGAELKQAITAKVVVRSFFSYFIIFSKGRST